MFSRSFSLYGLSAAMAFAHVEALYLTSRARRCQYVNSKNSSSRLAKLWHVTLISLGHELLRGSSLALAVSAHMIVAGDVFPRQAFTRLVVDGRDGACAYRSLVKTLGDGSDARGNSDYARRDFASDCQSPR